MGCEGMKFQIPMDELRRVAELYPTVASKQEAYNEGKKIEGGINILDAKVGDWYLYEAPLNQKLIVGILYKDSDNNWIVVRDDWLVSHASKRGPRNFGIFSNFKSIMTGSPLPQEYRRPNRGMSWDTAKGHIKITSSSSKFMNWIDGNPLSSVK